MKIVNAPPPNFAAIVAVFPRARRPGVVFTFGDTIYAPGRDADLSPWIVAHEAAHALRQGPSPEVWWGRYLADPKFRFDEEVYAHRVEWRTWINMGPRSRHDRRGMMRVVAGRLSGPLYGELVSFSSAKAIILQESVAA